MSLYAPWQINEPREFDNLGRGIPTSKERLTKECWYMNTEIHWGTALVILLSPKGSWDDEYLMFRYKRRTRSDRVSKTFSKHPYHYNLLRRQFKVH